jgi:hypothetical protein
MSQSARQRNLFAAEDFTVVYDTFRQSNFKSYDYETIKSTMVEYIRRNYPENFNDWIRSSEFTSLIELMAFLGHNLAFRNDLAVRENFLSTAERRESVLKIVDFLGYNPARAFPATGFLKIKSLQTNQNVYDVSGKTLKNIKVDFVDSTDSGFQNFMLIMNEVLSPSNRFGNPYDRVSIDGINNDLYVLNKVVSDKVVYSFKASVSGVKQPFEIHNLSSAIDSNSLTEPSPNSLNGFNVLYKSDNKGIGSKNTGFFFGFKQGTLQFSDYTIDSPVSNLKIDIPTIGINDTDVWVQSISEDGIVLENWEKVDSVNGFSQLFNTTNPQDRKLFSVKTIENDGISINFGDGEFSDIPRGIIRVWYRLSLNQSYSLNPDDVGNINLSIPYIASDNNQYTAIFTLELQEPVTNASSRETLETIKSKAGRIFNTQDRMITAEDYAVYPVSVSANVVKIKSINRTHSGHSVFIDFNDPTSQYQNVEIFGDDGYLYTENILNRVTIPSILNLSNSQLFDLYLKNIPSDPELLNFYYKYYNALVVTQFDDFEWQQVTYGPNTSSGYITSLEVDETVIRRVGQFTDNTILRAVRPNSIIEFVLGDNDPIWARVISVYEDGLGIEDSTGNPTGLTNKGNGSILLSKTIPDGYKINRVFPAYSKNFTESERTEILRNLSFKNDFGLRYDNIETTWKIIKPEDLAPYTPMMQDEFSLDNAGNITNNNLDNSWLIRFAYSGSKWTVLTRDYRIVFGSDKTVRFYNIKGNYKINRLTQKSEKDRVKILPYNTFSNTFTPIEKSIDLYSHRYYTETDGQEDDHKIIMTLADVNNDGYPDNPVIINDFIGNNTIPIVSKTDGINEYFVYSETGTPSKVGRANIAFKWTRIADTEKRIDPSISNVIDTFIITSGYDRSFRSWLSSNRDKRYMPIPPTSDTLALQFANINRKKSISDSVIYRSGKYKILFGELADLEHQARFRVVKSPSTDLNDGEIKSRIVLTIQEFFNINNWDFGETFYFTELSAFIHNRLSGIISSVVIVPVQENGVFGNLFQLTPDTDELFIPDISIDYIDIVDSFTESNLRLRRT